MVAVGESTFVRSVREIRDDGSLELYSALSSGVVIRLSEPGSITEHFAALSASESMESAQLSVLFDCTLRGNAIRMASLQDDMLAMMRHAPMIGFSTYGEQCFGYHVNQTVTGAVFHGRQ